MTKSGDICLNCSLVFVGIVVVAYLEDPPYFLTK